MKVILTWTHAHQLFAILKVARIDLAQIGQIFVDSTARLSTEVFLQDRDYWNDISHPRFITYKRICLCGLLYAVDGNEELLSAEITQQAADLAFPINSDNVRDGWSILRLNAAFSKNTCQSFLGKNLGEEIASLTDFLEPGQYSNQALAGYVQELVDSLQTDAVDQEANLAAWSMLMSIIQDAELPSGLGRQIVRLFDSTDWVGLYLKNRALWRASFQLAILQFAWLLDESLGKKLQNVLREVANACATSESTLATEEVEQICQLLLEGALRTAISPATGQVSIEVFGNAVIDLAFRWKPIRTLGKALLLAMCEDMPLTYAQQLWPSLILLRAM